MKHCRISIGFIAFVGLTTGCSLDTTPLFSARNRIDFPPGSQDAGEPDPAGNGAIEAGHAGGGEAGGPAGAGGAAGKAGSGGGGAGASGSGGKSGAGGSAGVTSVAGAGAGGSAGVGSPSPQCGNGQLEGSEECDDGNTTTEACSYGQQSCSVCNSVCRTINGVTSYCGNGQLDSDHGEQCDDGNTLTEACSYGQQSCSVCNNACQNAAGATTYCGNGSVESGNGEQCDDGNGFTEACAYGLTSCSICNSACHTAAGATHYCGNTDIDAAMGEQCDDGNAVTEACNYGVTSCSICNSTCHTAAGATSYCGNASVDAAKGEQCDDGNTVTEACVYGQQSCTVCNNSCHSVAGATKYCGNSTVEMANGEQCDDGNTATETCATGQTSCLVCNSSCKRVAGALRYTAQTFSMADAYYMTADGSGTSCVSTSLGDVVGHEPAESGTYPVAVFLVGMLASHNHPLAQAFTARMAARGFVASSVEYVNDSYPGSCEVLQAKANCVFSSGSANSAIAKLCARAKADCSKGIVVAGINEGANLASLAKNYDSRARAAFVMGDIDHMGGTDLQSCLQASATTFSVSQMRAFSGEQDTMAGNSSSAIRSDLISLTGRSCGSTVWDCLQSDGSGWYMVKSADVDDGTADHCYMLDGGCTSTLDPTFDTGTAPWSLDANVDWLTSQVAP